jgi:phosphatidylglycerol lysyltransferase
MITLLSPYVSGASVLGALLAFRGIYYFVPLLVAITLLAVNELTPAASRARDGRPEALAPDALAGAAFLAGALLLLLAVTPASGEHLARVRALIPAPLADVSHLGAWLGGAGLLFAAYALRWRRRFAVPAAAALLALGATAALLKGLHYIEAALLAVVLIALLWLGRSLSRRDQLPRPNR